MNMMSLTLASLSRDSASLLMALLISLIAFAQAYWLGWMIP